MKSPSHLSKPAKRIWREIYQTTPAGHLADADAAVLVEYCETVADLRAARRQWREDGASFTQVHSNGTTGPNPQLVAIERLQRTLATLSTKLRLCPQSRMSPQSSGKHSFPSKPDEFARFLPKR